MKHSKRWIGLILFGVFGLLSMFLLRRQPEIPTESAPGRKQIAQAPFTVTKTHGTTTKENASTDPHEKWVDEQVETAFDILMKESFRKYPSDQPMSASTIDMMRNDLRALFVQRSKNP